MPHHAFGIEDLVNTLDLARAQVRQLQRAAERRFNRNTLRDSPTSSRRLTGRATGEAIIRTRAW
jgi:hypothetical protein